MLSNDGLLVVAGRLDVHTLPVVLSAAPQQDSFDEWVAARRRAAMSLTRSGIVDADGDVDPNLAGSIHTLAQPDCELSARIHTAATNPVRICLARRGDEHALAVRTGSTFDIRPVWVDDPGPTLLPPILNALGSCPPADLPAFSAPSADLADRLDEACGAADFADVFYALGVASRDATRYGLAFASCRARAELVAHAHLDGVTVRPPGAVAIYDTDHGRIVAAPSVSLDREVWSTITPGTDHRIVQAISALIDSLPGGRWMPQ